MQKLFLYLKGYIYLKVTGFAPERFVNLCGNKGILLWDILIIDNAYFMHMKLQDFFLIAPIVRKSKTKVVLLKRIGLPFLLPQILRKRMFLMGFMTTFFLWYISSFFVWEIDINGNSYITDEEIIRTLSEVGISIGDKVNSINYEELEKYFREKYKEIVWISIKQRGTIIDLSLKENAQIEADISAPGEADNMSCDLISAEMGTIHSMVVRQGLSLVKIGDIVEADQILITGKTPIYNDDGTIRTYKYVHADADIDIQYEMPIYIELPKVYVEKYYTNRTSKSVSVTFGNGVDFVLHCLNKEFCKEDIMNVIYDDFRFLLWKIPMKLCVETQREYMLCEYENNFANASVKLQDEFAYFLANLEEKGVQIISKNVKIEEDYAKWVIVGNITVLSHAYIENQIEELYE